jgi:hypothetical protein
MALGAQAQARCFDIDPLKDCERGDRKACEQIALACFHDDPDYSVVLLRRFCDDHDELLPACSQILEDQLPTLLPFENMQADCDAKTPFACYLLGVAADMGLRSGPSLPLMESACDGGVADACFWRAKTGDLRSAKPFFERACAGGQLESCAQLPSDDPSLKPLCRDGRGDACLAARDFERASELLHPACIDGDQPSCALLLRSLLKMNAPDKIIVSYASPLCSSQYVFACRAAGASLRRLGKLDRASEMFKLGCDSNDPACCDALR